MMIVKGFLCLLGRLSGLKKPDSSHAEYMRSSVAAGSYGLRNLSGMLGIRSWSIF